MHAHSRTCHVCVSESILFGIQLGVVSKHINRHLRKCEVLRSVQDHLGTIQNLLKCHREGKSPSRRHRNSSCRGATGAMTVCSLLPETEPNSPSALRAWLGGEHWQARHSIRSWGRSRKGERGGEIRRVIWVVDRVMGVILPVAAGSSNND